ncbi:hypothetical protein DMA11_20640 [Marinilabiliaceae bacterium JC017]|nr:hypothetical protein DMA11_20640 [Marinilabiliaceae bacterium JC017]
MPIRMIDCLLIVVLITILMEDIRHRQVHLYLFAAGLLLFVIKFWQSGAEMEFVLINGGFLGVQLLGIISFSYIKNRQFYPFTGIIGVGDLLMWGLLIFGFSPVNFMVYFILSLFFSLIIHGLYTRKQSKTIPLAGLQSLSYLVIVIAKLLGWKYNCYLDDQWINILARGI